jgi:hypothetical protein
MNAMIRSMRSADSISFLQHRADARFVARVDEEVALAERDLRCRRPARFQRIERIDGRETLRRFGDVVLGRDFVGGDAATA